MPSSNEHNNVKRESKTAFFKKLDSHLGKYFNTYTLLALAVTFIPVYLALNDYFNGLIGKQINSPEYIDKLSKNFRPYLLLNLNGNIVYEHGALEYIEKIEMYPDSIIFPDTKSFGFFVTCKKYLNNKPIIENISPHKLAIQSTRFGDKDWAVRIVAFDFIEQYQNEESLFRIEILP